ncbi:DUF1361 domain-containing protein [Flavobacterium sp.]|uniref:DUF1361 domain-containing protein n=1 Tax=Flavobacterium sp. TaxID=239 RepID=UPI0038D3E07C
MVIYCLSLLIVRAKITQNIFLFFLIWNLFLALIPYLLIIYLRIQDDFRKNKIKTYLIIAIWLAFLPNSFYIITDLVHIFQSHPSTFWFDLTLISSFAFVGFFIGIQSIFEFEKIAMTFYNEKMLLIIIPILCFLCGFGVYLGRILRYNSWDIISNPKQLVIDIGLQLITAKTILFSVHFGIFIYLFYTSKKIIFNTKSN